LRQRIGEQKSDQLGNLVSEKIVVAAPQVGQRLDHFLVQQYPDISRSALGRLIRVGAVRVNGDCVKAGYRVHGHDTVIVVFPPPEPAGIVPQALDFGILYEDSEFLVVDKPAGLVVHPGDGHPQGTLVNGLLHRYPHLPGNDGVRPGIVHRLDKDTSGVLLVAKSDKALEALGELFRNRLIAKTYHAILLRYPGRDTGRLVAPIGRHPVQRKKMAIQAQRGRYAATNWRVQQRWPGFSFVEIGLETGRTHQIRVHMASLGAPVAGDTLYGGRTRETLALSVERQLLHASTLEFQHPFTSEQMRITAPLPEDMNILLALLDKRDTEA